MWRGLGAAFLCVALATGAQGAKQKKPKETVLYDFTGAGDGAYPEAGLIQDAQGNFYGTTHNGGTANLGSVFKLAAGGVESVLHSFTGGSDGEYPFGGLLLDAHGNLYGTTPNGGGTGCGGVGCGIVYEITAAGTEVVLYRFLGLPDGAYPFDTLVMDSQGNLYGTASGGGQKNWGSVFEITQSGTEKTLYSFTGGADGGLPIGGVIFGTDGNLYGTTQSGGVAGCSFGQGCGVVFEVAPAGGESLLYTFSGGTDGGSPYGGLVRDGDGNFYGTTLLGGSANLGTVFQLTTGGKETVLHSFGGLDGATPEAGLILDAKGNLFGTTFAGGTHKKGTLFEVAANGTESVLYNFGGKHGYNPQCALVQDAAGNFYGTTVVGGTHKFGTVFELVVP